MNENNEKSISDSSSKIYLFSYPYKNGIKKYELTQILDVEQHHIPRSINSDRLVERGYLTFEQLEDKRTSPYIIKVKLDILIERIKSSPVGNKLDEFDIHVLKNILDSESFRKIVKDNIDSERKYPDPFTQLLYFFDVWIMVSKKLRPILKNFKGFRTNFKSIDDYDSYMIKIKPLAKQISPLIIKDMHSSDKIILNSYITIEDIVILCVPDRTLRKISSGFTHISKLYYGFEKVINHIEKKEEFINKYLEKNLSLLTKKSIHLLNSK